MNTTTIVHLFGSLSRIQLWIQLAKQKFIHVVDQNTTFIFVYSAVVNCVSHINSVWCNEVSKFHYLTCGEKHGWCDKLCENKAMWITSDYHVIIYWLCMSPQNLYNYEHVYA